MVQGILYLLLAFAALALTFFFWVYANVSGNILGLVGVIAGLTITWFASRAMGKRFSRFASGIHVIDFGQKNVESRDRKYCVCNRYQGACFQVSVIAFSQPPPPYLSGKALSGILQ